MLIKAQQPEEGEQPTSAHLEEANNNGGGGDSLRASSEEEKKVVSDLDDEVHQALSGASDNEPTVAQ